MPHMIVEGMLIAGISARSECSYMVDSYYNWVSNICRPFPFTFLCLLIPSHHLTMDHGLCNIKAFAWTCVIPAGSLVFSLYMQDLYSVCVCVIARIMAVLRFYRKTSSESGRSLQRVKQLFPQVIITTELCYNVEVNGETNNKTGLKFGGENEEVH